MRTRSRKTPGRWATLVTVWLGCCLVGLAPVLAAEAKALRIIVVYDKQEAEAIRKQLLQGASFSALAGTKSLGPARRFWGYSGMVKPEEVQPALRTVLRKLREGQISEVLKLGQRYVILKVISPQIEQHIQAADAASEQGHTEVALRELQAALRLEKDNIEVLLRLGVVYDEAQQYEEALKYLEQAQRYAPTATRITMLRGAVYTRAAIARKRARYARQAIQAYRQALARDQRLAPAVHFGLGKVYLLALRQPRKALPHLEKAAAITPRVPEVHRLLIQAYYDTKRYERAWQHLRLAQSLGYEFPDLLKALHKIKRKKKR